MNEYKVIFKDNKPVAAHKLEKFTDSILKLTKKNNSRYVDWLVVFGYNEDDAIQSANNFVTYYSRFFAKHTDAAMEQ